MLSDSDSKQKVMLDKERRKREDEEKHVRQLDKISQENVGRR